MTGPILLWIIASIICLWYLIAEARQFLQNEAATVSGVTFFGIMCLFAVIPFLNLFISLALIGEFFANKVWPAFERWADRQAKRPIWSKKLFGPFNKTNSNKKVV